MRRSIIGRAKRGQSRGWLGFRTGVALHEVYLRKPPSRRLPVWRMALLRCSSDLTLLLQVGCELRAHSYVLIHAIKLITCGFCCVSYTLFSPTESRNLRCSRP
jgi:hypothetical protein